MSAYRSIALATVLLVASGAAAEPPGEVSESTDYPIRIFYDESMSEVVAQTLAEAEAAWEDAVVLRGLPAPLTMFGDTVGEGFDVLLSMEIAGVGTYEVLGDHPATSITDCPTLAWFNPLAAPTDEMVTMTMHHLLTRQSLRAVECIEPYRPTYDMFAVTYGIHYMGADHPYWLPYELPGFQALPWKSLDYGGMTADDIWYPYGSALFTWFLDETFGDGDATMLIDVWERAAQDGTIESWDGPFAYSDVENEPDVLDAIAAELEEQGSSFDEAFVEFVEWRFFIGADDDGAHSPMAADWTGGEVAREIVLGADDLPVVNQVPENPVSEYGATYIEIETANLTDLEELVVELFPDAETAWWAGLFLIGESGPATVQEVEIDDGFGSGTVEGPAGYERVVIALANLGDGDHDLDAADWAPDDFGYSIGWPGADGDSDTDADTDADADADSGVDAGASGKSDDSCGCRFLGHRSTDAGLFAVLLTAILG